MQRTGCTACSEQVVLYAVNRLYCMQRTGCIVCSEQVVLPQAVIERINKFPPSARAHTHTHTHTQTHSVLCNRRVLTVK